MVTPAFVRRIIDRAAGSMMGLGKPKVEYSLDKYADHTFEAVALLLVDAHETKYDLVSLMWAAMEEVRLAATQQQEAATCPICEKNALRAKVESLERMIAGKDEALRTLGHERQFPGKLCFCETASAVAYCVGQPPMQNRQHLPLPIHRQRLRQAGGGSGAIRRGSCYLFRTASPIARSTTIHGGYEGGRIRAQTYGGAGMRITMQILSGGRWNDVSTRAHTPLGFRRVYQSFLRDNLTIRSNEPVVAYRIITIHEEHFGKDWLKERSYGA